MNLKQLLIVALGSALMLATSLLPACGAQDQESVADAARKAQADKKTEPKPKLVIDNDSLDSLKGTISVVGAEAAPPEDQAKAAKAPGNKEEKAPVKDEAYWRKTFADANKKLADDEHELDILQREYNLKQEQFYQDPMASLKQEYTRQDLDDTKAKIDAKSASVDADKQAISDLEDALRQAGGDPGWATPPSQPASDQEQPPPQPEQSQEPQQPQM